MKHLSPKLWLFRLRLTIYRLRLVRLYNGIVSTPPIVLFTAALVVPGVIALVGVLIKVVSMYLLPYWGTFCASISLIYMICFVISFVANYRRNHAANRPNTHTRT